MGHFALDIIWSLCGECIETPQLARHYTVESVGSLHWGTRCGLPERYVMDGIDW